MNTERNTIEDDGSLSYRNIQRGESVDENILDSTGPILIGEIATSLLYHQAQVLDRGRVRVRIHATK